MNHSIENLVKGMNFKDKDVKQLANLVVFSHKSLRERFEMRLESCEDGIHCNQDEIEKLARGELAEDIASQARKSMLKHLAASLTLIATFLGILKFALALF